MLGDVWLVEDSRVLRDEITLALVQAGFAVTGFICGGDALLELAKTKPDMLLLDAVLPDVEIEGLCSRLAESHRMRNVPLIIIASDAESAGALLSRHGAIEDCIVKPFTPGAFVERVLGVMQRLHPKSISGRFPAAMKTQGSLVCGPDSRQIVVDGAPMQLAPIEHQLLLLLLGKKGMTLSRAELTAAIWDDAAGVSLRSVDVAMVSLRRKLGRHGGQIKTVRGIGYRFIE